MPLTGDQGVVHMYGCFVSLIRGLREFVSGELFR